MPTATITGVTFLSGGKPIRLDVIEPPQPTATVTRFPAILLLHGAGGNIGFWLDRIAPFVARLGIAVYAVHYFHRTGTVRADAATLRDGHHVPLWLETVRDALATIAQRPTVDPTRIALVGISLGAYLSLALATLPHRPNIRAIVELSGGLARPYAANATSAFPPTLILHGDHDSIVPVSEAHALDATLTHLKVLHQLHILANEGHWFSPQAQFRILTSVAAFLVQHLEPLQRPS
jgi:dienelactone hydrolase